MKNKRKKKIKNLRVFLLSFVTAMTLSMISCGKEAKDLQIVQEQEYIEEDEKNHLTFDITTEQDINKLQTLLTQDSKKSVQSLTIHSSHINIDLSFLENCPNLTELSIDGPVINSYYLSKCSKLKTLNLTNAGISNIQFLSELEDIENLNLSGNYIEEIQVLEKLSKLLNLNLENNPKLEQIEVLRCCKELRNLNLSKTKIKSLEGLEKLTKLTGLYLNYDRIENFYALAKLNHLRILEMDHTGIEDLSVLENLHELESLYLEENNISNPLVLFELESLKHLNIANNYIPEHDIRKLVEAKKLSEDMMDIMIKTNNQYQDIQYIKVENSTDVNRPYKITLLKLEGQMKCTQEILTDDIYKVQNILSHNDKVISLILEDISVDKKTDFLNHIQNPNRLRYLYLGKCSQDDLQHISRFKNLRGLGISSEISNYDFLKKLSKLEELQIQGLEGSIAENTEGLQNLLQLKYLCLSGCGISDIDFLRNLTNLETLILHDNNIENIDVLEILQNLKYLDIRKNVIQDISPIYEKASELEVLALAENCIPIEAFEELEQYKVFISETSRSSQRGLKRVY